MLFCNQNNPQKNLKGGELFWLTVSRVLAHLGSSSQFMVVRAFGGLLTYLDSEAEKKADQGPGVTFKEALHQISRTTRNSDTS